MIGNKELQFPGFGRYKSPGAAVPRLNSDKSFVVSEQKDIPEKNKMFRGGAHENPALFIYR